MYLGILVHKKEDSHVQLSMVRLSDFKFVVANISSGNFLVSYGHAAALPLFFN